MVNWIKNNMNEYKQIPGNEDPQYLTEAHMVFKDACSEEVMEWSNEKKIELDHGLALPGIQAGRFRVYS